MNEHFYNEVLLDHNLHPQHLHELSCATCSHAGLNPSCGDEITLHLQMKDGKVNIEALQAITFDPYTHGYYQVSKRVGEAFKDGLKLK